MCPTGKEKTRNMMGDVTLQFKLKWTVRGGGGCGSLSAGYNILYFNYKGRPGKAAELCSDP